MTNLTNETIIPRTTTGTELLAKEFAPVNWAVPDLLPEGVALFAGKAKMGKSWLALGLCIAVATGGYALGKKPVVQRESLYLALEDNERRLQDRLRTLIREDADLAGLHCSTQWPRMDEDGVATLDAWLSQHSSTGLVVIDTLKKIRPRDNGRRNIYDVDYEALEPLGALAATHNVSILVVHHMNKMVDPDDPFDSISGSTGLTGSVDGVLILNRERGNADAFLYVDGRDIKEQGELALSWDDDVCTWTLKGNADEYRLSKERQAIVEVIRTSGRALTPTEVADALGKNLNTIKTTMWRMSNDQVGVLKAEDGKYSVNLVTPVNPTGTVAPVAEGSESVSTDDTDASAQNPASVDEVDGVYDDMDYEERVAV